MFSYIDQIVAGMQTRLELIPDVQDMAARLTDELAALEKAFGTPRSRS